MVSNSKRLFEPDSPDQEVYQEYDRGGQEGEVIQQSGRDVGNLTPVTFHGKPLPVNKGDAGGKGEDSQNKATRQPVERSDSHGIHLIDRAQEINRRLNSEPRHRRDSGQARQAGQAGNGMAVTSTK